MTAHQRPHWFLRVSGLACKTEPLAFKPPPPPILPSFSSSSISQLLQLESSARGLFSRMGSENSALFVLAAVSFPAEEAWCPEDWGRTSQGPRGRGRFVGWGRKIAWRGTGGVEGVMGPIQTGCEGSSSRAGARVEAMCRNPTSVLSTMVLSASSPFPRWQWMALKYAFISCMISVSCDSEREREREGGGGQIGGSRSVGLALSQLGGAR